MTRHLRRLVLFACCCAVVGAGWTRGRAPVVPRAAARDEAGWNARRPAANTARTWVPGEILLKFRNGAPQALRAQVLDALGAADTRTLGRSGTQRSRIQRLGVEEAVARFRDHPAIEFIEPNYLVRTQAVPDDERFDQLWGLHNTGQTGGTPGADVGAVDAWEITTGSREIVVAIIDTGVDHRHPDLADNVWINPREVPDNGVDDDGNGFVDDVRGWDFRNDDNDPDDDHGHGTHVAGTVGAIGDNGIGVVGVNWRVQLMPLKFLHLDGYGNVADAIASIDYATDNGARVMSNSWGGGYFSLGLRLAVERAERAGIVFAAAAGNLSHDVETVPFYPASYDLANIIAVAAVNHRDDRPNFSNWGAVSVDLAAPGVNILSTFPGEDYGLLDGTSMATPHVAGAAALLLSRHPLASGSAIRQALLDNVDPVAGLLGQVASGGRLNAAAAFASADAVSPARVADLRVVAAGATRVDLEWTARGDDGDDGRATRYEIRYDTQPFDAAEFALADAAPGVQPPAPPGTVERFSVDDLDFDTRYWFALRVLDEWGNASDLSDVVSVTTAGAPGMSVSPARLDADLLTGESVTRTVAIDNDGIGDLTFRVLVNSAPSARLDLLLVQSGADLEPLSQTLGALDDFAVVDVLDAGTGDLPANPFDGYDAVIVSAIEPFATPDALGDALAGFVDLGGGVVLTLNATSAGWEIGGRFGDAGYSPVLTGDTTLTRSGLGAFDADHPVMQGVAEIRAGFLAVMPPAPGAGVVAWWRFGEPLVVLDDPVSAKVAAVNLHLDGSEFWSGDVPRLLANTARWVAGGAAWLHVDPPHGTVGPGDVRSLNVTFDAYGLHGGSYTADLSVIGNAPLAPDGQVALRLEVTGAPDIAVAGAPVDFGELFAGAEAVKTITVANTGTDRLTILGLDSDHSAFLVDPLATTLEPGERHEVDVAFRPVAAGVYQGRLAFTSDDPDEPLLTVALRGTALAPPVIELIPPVVTASMIVNESSAHTVVIHNRGEYVLDLQVRLERTTDNWSPFSFADGFEAGVDRWIDRGGNGVKQVVFDTAGAGIASLRQWNADSGHEGGLFRRLAASRPRYLRFMVRPGSTEDDDGFVALGNGTGQHAVWFYAKSNGDFYVNASDADRSFPYAERTWYRVELRNIDFERHRFDYWIDGVPIGLDVAFRQPVDGIEEIDLHNFSADSEAWWDDLLMYREVGVFPSTGSIAPGDSLELTVVLEPHELLGGDYGAQLVVESNDPVDPRLGVPVELTIVGTPVLEVSTGNIDFGDTFLGGVTTRTISVSNAGNDALHVEGVTIDHPAFTASAEAFEVPIGGSRELELSFAAVEPGPADATLRFDSNDSHAASPTVALRGVGVPPPDVMVSPTALQATLSTGELTTRTVQVSNAGAAPLAWVAVPAASADASKGVPVDASVVLFEDFEDGDYDGWQTTDMTGTKLVVSTTGANGTGSSFYHSNPSHLPSGVHRALDRARARYVSFWARSGSRFASDTIVILRNQAGAEAIRFDAHSGGRFHVNGRPMSDALVPYVANRWYFIELRNVDLVRQTVDLFVDGQPATLAVPLAGPQATAWFDRIDLVNDVPGTQSWWDEILVDEADRVVSATPRSGVIAAGAAIDLTVTVDARNLIAGSYRRDLLVLSDDPDEPSSAVAVDLEVLGVPQLATPTHTVDFGVVNVGMPVTLEVHVVNVGTGELEVSGLSLEPAAFSSSAEPFRLPVGGSQRVSVVFAPAQASVHAGRLVFHSDDPRGDREVLLAGSGRDAPRLDIDPPALHETLFAGGVVERSLTVTNVGGEPLQFGVTTDVGEQAIVFTDDMESGTNGWSTERYAGKDDLWHRTTFNGPSTSWWCGVEGQGSYSTHDHLSNALVSPPIELREVVAPVVLQFDEWYDTEPEFDQCLVDVSTDGGVTWTPLRGAYGDAPSGQSGGWTVESLDLSPFIGETIRVRFYFETRDPINNFGIGWFVDNVTVRGNVASWLGIAPRGVDVAPGAATTIDVRFDTAAVRQNELAAAIRVLSNDPFRPALTVPVRLTVQEPPTLALPGAMIAPQSGQGFQASGALTVHAFNTAFPPAGGATLRVQVDGDFGDPGQIAAVSIDGDHVGTITGGSDFSCDAARADFTLRIADLLAWTADGRIEVEVRNSSNVLAICPYNHHEVTFEHRPDIGGLDFGEVPVGEFRELTLPLENAGDAELVVDAITTDTADVVTSVGSLSLPPGATADLGVRWAPASSATLAATLTLVSNDARRPTRLLPLTGAAVAHPHVVLALDPIAAALPPHATTVRTKIVPLANDGGGALVWTVRVDGPATVDPAGGELAAGESTELALTFDAAGLLAGDHPGALVVQSNDPARPEAVVPFVLHVGEVALELARPAGSWIRTPRRAAVGIAIQLPEPFDPSEVRADSVRINGELAPLALPFVQDDRNGDGTPELVIFFSAGALRDLLVHAGPAGLVITGEVEDRTWFRGQVGRDLAPPLR